MSGRASWRVGAERGAACGRGLPSSGEVTRVLTSNWRWETGRGGGGWWLTDATRDSAPWKLALPQTREVQQRAHVYLGADGRRVERWVWLERGDARLVTGPVRRGRGARPVCWLGLALGAAVQERGRRTGDESENVRDRERERAGLRLRFWAGRILTFRTKM